MQERQRSDNSDHDMASRWCDAELVRLLDGLLAAADEQVYVYDRAGRVVYASPSGLAANGLARSSLLGKTWRHVLPDGHLVPIEQLVQQVFATGTPHHDEGAFPTPLGERTYTYTFSPLRGAGGAVEAVVAAVRDVTGERAAERALRQAEERWKTLLDFAPSNILTVSHDLRITFLNHVGSGFRLSEVLGHDILEFTPPRLRASVRAAYAALFENGLPMQYESEVLGPDGQQLWFQANAALLPGEGEALVITTDVTKLKCTSEALARKQAELAQARELERLKDNFVNAVTHELRTPLSSIFGFAELLEDQLKGPLNADQLAFVRELQRAAQRLDNLVGDLLDYARMEAGTFRLRLAETDVRGKIRDTARSLEPQFRDAGLRLELGLPDAPLLVLADPQRIGQVLLNLMQNAVKFSPSGATIRVDAHQEGDRVVCSVTDQGPGIPPAEVPKLFRAFSQLEQGLKMGVGTGLGLSISKAIVEAHAGAIGVRSTPGHGATFWFSLPTARSVPLERLPG